MTLRVHVSRALALLNKSRYVTPCVCHFICFLEISPENSQQITNHWLYDMMQIK